MIANIYHYFNVSGAVWKIMEFGKFIAIKKNPINNVKPITLEVHSSGQANLKAILYIIMELHLQVAYTL